MFGVRCSIRCGLEKRRSEFTTCIRNTDSEYRVQSTEGSSQVEESMAKPRDRLDHTTIFSIHTTNYRHSH